MAVIKCKMCGGNLDITEGSTVCECEYCGTRQTVPTADNEKKLTLFARAGRLLRACEFDKAAGVFESIVSDFPEEAEAYWGLVLCRFGIEYVDDPATGKKVPTCHRSGFDSVMHDSDFEQACENADPIARRQYREEAKQIEELRKAIIEVSGREAPYDIFICYKETDPNGGRTLDSVLAQDVYDALTAKGYRVFFSRITLEDKLGVEYEPYIFAALNSARVMLVFGTDYEYFNAVWVKNEWSRFLKLMAKDKSRHLIPCFRGIDAYDMPEEFARLQSQDMGKVGAVQDLLRGVEKLLPKKNEAPKEAPAAPVFAGGPNVTALLDRGNMALEDAEFDKARDFFDQVLNMDSRSADAYLGLAMADTKSRSRDELFKTGTKPGSNLGDNRNMKRALQFGGVELKAWYDTVKKTKEENEAKAAEEKRIAREKAEEEARLAREKEKERARLAREREELERRQREERYRLERERFAAVMRSTRQRITQADGMISASHSYTAAVRSDGTILLTCKVFNGSSDAVTWQGIKAISSGTNRLVGIRTDGTVTAVGSNVYHECEVSDWRDIVTVAIGNCHTVGLRSDGTVIAVGQNNGSQCDVSDWRDIVAVAAGGLHTVGLRSDGTVAAVGFNADRQCEVSDWRDIIAVAAGGLHTVGLRADGTLVTAGKNSNECCNVNGWKEIVAIATGPFHTVGVRANGTVVAAGRNNDAQCRVDRWQGVVAVAAGTDHTVGLCSDGTLVAAGSNSHGQCSLSDWKLFYSLDTLEDERKAAAEKAEAERKARVEALKKEAAFLTTELSGLRGIFTGKRRKEIESRLAEITTELKN